jgi:hypothetical protein
MKTMKTEYRNGQLLRHVSLRGGVGWNANEKFSRIRLGPEDWLVYGRVLGPDGTGMPGLRVSVFDKDLLFDDRLGETGTDSDGEFYVLYHKNDFKDLIENQPDLYIKVMNKKGRILFNTEKGVRWQSNRVECFEIEIR